MQKYVVSLLLDNSQIKSSDKLPTNIICIFPKENIYVVHQVIYHSKFTI